MTISRADAMRCLTHLELEAYVDDSDHQTYGVTIVGHSKAVEAILALDSSQARIKVLEEALADAQRIIERDFPNGQLAIDIRAALGKKTT